MKHAILICAMVFATGLCGALRADGPLIVRRARTWPRVEPGIPARDYQFQSRSRSEAAISRTGVLIQSDLLGRADVAELVEPPRGTRLRETITRESVVPFRDLSTRARGREVTLQRLDRDVDRRHETAPPRDEAAKVYLLEQSGLAINHCEISQIALQLHEGGRWVLSLRADQNRRPAPGEPAPYNPWLHIKRNEFVVRLRCYGNFQTEPTETAVAAGKPVLADLDELAFWVENGEPRYLRHSGSDARIERHFSMIDRVEIEFFYR